MILKDKNAVLYGVSESLGGAMALALSEAGAKVFLTAHRLENAEKSPMTFGQPEDGPRPTKWTRLMSRPSTTTRIGS